MPMNAMTQINACPSAEKNCNAFLFGTERLAGARPPRLWLLPDAELLWPREGALDAEEPRDEGLDPAADGGREDLPRTLPCGWK